MPGGLTEGQWADEFAKKGVADTSLVQDEVPEDSKCPLCEERAELLEHHVSYAERFGLFEVEIVLEVCMSCHHRIHKETGFREELNPVDPTGDAGRQHENFLVQLLLERDEIDSLLEIPDQKYQLFKNDGEWIVEPV
jgi:hypothetical protein